MVHVKLLQTNRITRRFSLLVALIVTSSLLFSLTAAWAQTKKLLAEGDRVLVNGKLIRLLAQPDTKAKPVEELVNGMTTRIAKIFKDKSGSTWVYLSDNAWGWAQTNPNEGTLLAAFEDKNLDRIEDSANKNIAANAKNIDALVARGMLYLSKRNAEGALADLSAAINVSPKDGRLYDYRARFYLAQNKFPEAAADAQEAIKLGRTLPATSLRYAVALAETDATPEAITAAFEATLALVDNYGAAHARYAIALVAQGDYTTANAALQKALEFDPQLAYVYGYRALVNIQLKRFETVEADLASALTADPSCTFCYFARGTYNADVKLDKEAALADFTKAIELSPDDPRSYVGRALVRLNAAKYSAVAPVSTAEVGTTPAAPIPTATPTAKPSATPRGATPTPEPTISPEDRDLAAKDLAVAINLNPQDPQTNLVLGKFNAADYKFAEAEANFKIAAASKELFAAESLVYIAQVQILQGKFDDAIANTTTILNSKFATERPELGATAQLVRGQANIQKEDFVAAQADYLAAFAAMPEFAKNYATAGKLLRVVPDGAKEILDLNQKINRRPATLANYLPLAGLYLQNGTWAEASTKLKAYRFLIRLPKSRDLNQFIVAFDKVIK